MRSYLVLVFLCMFANGNVFAAKIDSASLASIVEALQHQARQNPPVFPLESYQGGIQSPEQGLRQAYFGFGERRYTDRFDFHPAMDVGYFPTETGYVTNEQGVSREVRAPQTYLKKVYAIQTGELVSIRLISTGYKLILKHKLETPYLDNEGNRYDHYYTCYRHLDSRSLSVLTEIARKFTGRDEASYQDLFGKYTFKAGEQIALVGFTPETGPHIPRAHLDFSLNLFGDPNKGSSIRNHALNPLLLFAPFEYADPRSHLVGENRSPAYQFVVDKPGIVAPGKGKDGRFVLQIHAGGRSIEGELLVSRYFALNAMDVTLSNAGRQLATHCIDRHQKSGYNTDSYDLLDNPDTSAPYFLAPLGEQGDVFEMAVVLPWAWFEKQQYDWSETGLVSINISSIWEGYLEGHNHALTISIPAMKTED